MKTNNNDISVNAQSYTHPKPTEPTELINCPDHPSQWLMYKTHDNKNTKSIRIQCI